ncbi:hypothetical protein [Rhodococcus sovatensis]|uniref:Transposase n=1 Tax=Rhodococcus sovatensis TaxID=1805840 RepID=A0ABZ2PJK0_9NOCA
MSELDEIAAELYAIDPAEFVAARKAAVAAAKKSGNRALASAIGSLRKPTTVAWMVNLLVREEPEDIAELFDIGDSLREAQRKSNTGDLRELSTARQKAIKSLTSRAAELARGQGKTFDENASREVGQTLGAALADPDIALRVRSGRVLTAESYSGFGPAALSLVPDTDDPPPQSDAPEDPALKRSSEHRRVDEKALAEAREALAEAKEDEASARGAAETAESDLRDAQNHLAEVKEQLERLRAELHAAEGEEATAREAEKSTGREARRLRRVLSDAEDRTAELQSVVDDLSS